MTPAQRKEARERTPIEELHLKLKASESDRDRLRKEVIRLMQENAALKNRIAIYRLAKKAAR